MAINKNQLRHLIIIVLKQMDLYSREAVELLMGTAAVESHLGTYLYQINGPAQGIFQMEPATERDLWRNFINLKSELLARIDIVTGFRELPKNRSTLKYNLKYQIVMSRIHYLRVPSALPDNIHEQAKYWKRYYNTHLGSGTVGGYLECYRNYVSEVFD